MDQTLDEVNRHCGEHVQAYASCVDSHGETWRTDCLGLRKALTECSDKNVTLMKMVRLSCQPAIDRYQECLSKNSQAPHVCIDALRDLYECTESVGQTMDKMNALQRKHGEPAPGKVDNKKVE
ncbi:hypothetical protein IWW37_003828 [Coemansia sp. RSA 2050]|nr:hypothetical protein IWW37_003827 [Coemansia sp. RSA 2050]KAJ2489617.1 hypothetical protein IWW37_003828 [Coemansia sp. RSA 2050]KAJ2731376.1 hypothetical protein IW152_004577 [Coemansia sp. BCRC 34962]